ncbi:MAG: hypothetical protein H6730_28645 [Deltaproteobacteria bacterium]|nr:hypothetical protein [Deltaproteobacteria bacterium]
MSFRALTRPVLWLGAALLGLAGVGVSSCASVKVWMDRRGLADYSELILRDFDADQARPPPPEPPRGSTGPVAVKAARLETWNLDAASIQEKLTFPARVTRPDGTRDEAIFYLYGNRDLEGADVILWVPGFGVSDFAFRFIKDFFINELEAGYTVVFYDIPFHLDRAQEGKAPGEGLVTGNNARNIELVEQIVDELGIMIEHLKARKVRSISGWGGSIGAAYLWLASARYELDHMTLMIPLVDWSTLIFHDELAPVRAKMNAAGVSDDELRRIYAAVSPIEVPTKVEASRIQLLYARLDQFTPEATTKAFAAKWGITDVHGYDESHASILTDSAMFEDNRRFIERMRPPEVAP